MSVELLAQSIEFVLPASNTCFYKNYKKKMNVMTIFFSIFYFISRIYTCVSKKYEILLNHTENIVIFNILYFLYLLRIYLVSFKREWSFKSGYIQCIKSTQQLCILKWKKSSVIAFLAILHFIYWYSFSFTLFSC